MLNSEIENLNFKSIPNVFLNGSIYKGDAAFINGYNGYSKTVDDSILCAIINHSVWDENGKPLYLKNANDNLMICENRRGQIINTNHL